MNTPLDLAACAPAVAELIDEGERAERSGRRDVARRCYEGALYKLRSEEGHLASALLRWIGRCYVDDGAYEAGADCIVAALAVAEAYGDDAAIAHAYNQMAAAHWRRSDLDAAEVEYLRARDFAQRAGDLQLLAMIGQNRGAIASARGEGQVALEHYAASLRSYETLGLTVQRGGVLNNLGLAYFRLNRLDEAGAAYHEALRLCDAGGDAHSRLMVRVNLIELWIVQGALDRAAQLCDLVLQESRQYAQPDALGEAHKLRGIIARVRGDLEGAERDLATAYDLASAREDRLRAAEAAREQAEVYVIAGRNRDALQALGRSHRLFTTLRAEQDLDDLRRRVERLEERFTGVVARWASEIESKDPYTRGHCDRVADYACALARHVGFEDFTMFWFRIGALLHDVGKIEVPTEILTKPGPLTPDERAVMQQHTLAGVRLLEGIDFPGDVLPVVRSHHERWDGAGYPDGMAGEAIPLAARIVNVVDVFDALTTTRPYRALFSADRALAIMADEAGRGAFDPDVFAAFEQVISERAPALTD